MAGFPSPFAPRSWVQEASEQPWPQASRMSQPRLATTCTHLPSVTVGHAGGQHQLYATYYPTQAKINSFFSFTVWRDPHKGGRTKGRFSPYTCSLHRNLQLFKWLSKHCSLALANFSVPQNSCSSQSIVTLNKVSYILQLLVENL